jgi:hypothetical protein
LGLRQKPVRVNSYRATARMVQWVHTENPCPNPDLEPSMHCTATVEHAAFVAAEATETQALPTPFASQDAPQLLSLELLRHVAGGGPGGSWSDGPGGSW